MKYTTEESLSEIMRRSEQVVQARNRCILRRLSGTICVLMAALILVITILPGHTAVSSSGTVYGSFLLSQEAGGYVLVAVIAFSLGVTVTLLCLRFRKR